MATIVRYTGDEPRVFAGTLFAPGDEKTFDDDDEAMLFVGVFTDMGRRPWLEAHKVSADGKEGKTTLAPDAQAGKLAAYFAQFAPPSSGALIDTPAPASEAAPTDDKE